jgi:hypothetical protein
VHIAIGARFLEHCRAAGARAVVLLMPNPKSNARLPVESKVKAGAALAVWL